MAERMKQAASDCKSARPIQTQAQEAAGCGVDPNPYYTIRATAPFVRRLASLSSESDRKLRQQCPTAFVGELVTLYPVVVPNTIVEPLAFGFATLHGQIAITQENGHTLRLDPRQVWSLIERPDGSSVLTARERL